MKPKAIIVDIDGTLANCEHRRAHLDDKNWPAFYGAMGDDTLNAWCEQLIGALRCELTVILCSGRPEDYRRVTETWLTFHEIGYDHLFMRGTGDYRKDSIVKEEILHREILPKWDIVFAVDDRKQVVEMWRKNGIVCLQCAEGDF